MTRLLVFVLIAACSKTEPPMAKPSSPLSAFSPLRGGSVMAIPPGERIVALHPQIATWWDHDAPVELALPDVPVDGARWSGARLRVGLGTLDLAARTWTAEPGLASLRRVSTVAWLDDQRVAVALGPPPQRMDQPAVARTFELVIAATDGSVRARVPLEPNLAPRLAASEDRVLVLGATARLFDRDGKLIAEGLSSSPSRAAYGAGMFAVTGNAGEVTLVRPSDGAVVATWHPEAAAVDAVPVPHGALAIDLHGTVRVACTNGAELKTVASASAGTFGLLVQLVGDRVVVAANGADPLRTARFADPCH